MSTPCCPKPTTPYCAAVAWRRIGLAWAWLALGSSLLACAATAASAPLPPSVESEAHEGPVRLKVRLTPEEAYLSDPLTLTIRIESEEGVSVQKPALGDVLAPLVIRDVRELLPRSENQRRILEQEYILEPTCLGRHRLGPIRATFRDLRRGEDPERTVQSEPLQYTILTRIDSEELSLAQLLPMATGVDPPEPGHFWGGWLLGGIAASLALGVLVWRRHVAARNAAVQVPSPRELARLELGEVFRQDLAEQDVKRFYVELSDVIRRYLERSFQVRAVEQTTEEFLQAIAREQTLGPDQAQRLRLFLESADQVKFAAYQPSSEDMEEAIRRARHVLRLSAPEVAA